MEVINHFIEDTPYINDLQKAFYKTYIGARVSLILAPAHEMILAGGRGADDGGGVWDAGGNRHR